MWKNYFSVAWRKIRTQRFYASINILGLAIGICCCLLITLWVRDELSYDQYHDNADRIYRNVVDGKLGDQLFQMAVSPAPLAQAIRDEVPEVEEVCRFREQGSWIVRAEDDPQSYSESKVIYADNEIFDVFTIPFVDGDPLTALEKPNTLALSQSTARKYFGNESALGKSMVLDGDHNYEVVGVYEDMPHNSHFHYDIFLSMEGLDESRQEIWLNNNFLTYMRLREGADAAQTEAKLNDLFRKYAAVQVKQLLGTTIEEFESAGNHMAFYLQPLSDIHLHSQLGAEHEANGDISNIWIFSAIAIFILLIACVNFMNLSTARSANRAKEVGMRKVLGSRKMELVSQFLAESILMSTIAVGIALTASWLILPGFNALTGKELSIPFTHPGFILLIIGSILLIGVIAGSYPAFFLSAFQPIKVLKSSNQQGINKGWLRRALVVSQFAISIVLMAGTGVIYYQLNYIQNKRVGFNKDQVLMLYTGNVRNDFQTLKEEITRITEVDISSATCFVPVEGRACRSSNAIWLEGNVVGQDPVSSQFWNVDFEYLETFGMQVKEGRFFSKQFATDSSAIVINEQTAREFGIQEDPLGKRIMAYVDPANMATATFTVIGVVEDFNYSSLHEPVGPLAMILEPDMTGLLSARFNANTDVTQMLSKIETVWDKFAPDEPFEYAFLDERFGKAYENERRLGTIVIIFAGLAIFIACLGLFALAAFTAERKHKEIGIRKVLGASVPGIVSLLSREFLLLVIIGLAIAVPISWFMMDKWLTNFAYRVEFPWWIYAIVGVVALIIAFTTISFQSVKAAVANPIKALRTE